MIFLANDSSLFGEQGSHHILDGSWLGGRNIVTLRFKKNTRSHEDEFAPYFSCRTSVSDKIEIEDSESIIKIWIESEDQPYFLRSNSKVYCGNKNDLIYSDNIKIGSRIYGGIYRDKSQEGIGNRRETEEYYALGPNLAKNAWMDFSETRVTGLERCVGRGLWECNVYNSDDVLKNVVLHNENSRYGICVF